MNAATSTPNGPATPAQSPETPRLKKSPPKETLPSDRLGFDKQVAALRAFVVAHNATGKPVTNDEAGKIAEMAAATIVVTNPFFCDVGLLQRQKDTDGFMPSADAIAYVQAYEWDPEKAREKLRPAFENTWFAKTLVPLLKFRSYDTVEALAVLAEKCAASKEYQPRLVPLIDYLVFAGIITKEGNQLKAVAQWPNGAVPVVAPPLATNPTVTPPEQGLEQYTLVLNAKTRRKFVVQCPPTITKGELERIRAWLGVQMIIDEENPE